MSLWAILTFKTKVYFNLEHTFVILLTAMPLVFIHYRHYSLNYRPQNQFFIIFH
jgi:hypothetical protein